MTNRQYHHVTSIPEHVFNNPWLAVDIETTGLNPRTDKIVGIAIAPNDTEAYYTSDIQSTLDNLNHSKSRLIFHNALFDLTFIHQIYPSYKLFDRVHDSMLLAQCFDPDYDSYRLKALAPKFLKPDCTHKALEMYEWLKQSDLTKEDIYKAPEKLLTEYACEDVLNTYALFVTLCGKLKERSVKLKRLGLKCDTWDYYTNEQLKMIYPVMLMQLEGVKLDLQGITQSQQRMEAEQKARETKLTNQWKEAIEKVEKILYQRLVEKRLKTNKSGKLKKMPPRVLFNWDSNQHLQLLLQTEFKIRSPKKTHKGNDSVDAAFLTSIAEAQPWLYDLLEYKKLKKLTSTYLSALMEKQEYGRLHASFHISGTSTGRLSSSNPNLQNLPKNQEIKRLFIPGTNKHFIYADYSQLELRIAAHFSQDPLLLDAYRTDKDLHRKTASIIYNVSEESIVSKDDPRRALGKTINFAIIYNASGYRIASILKFLENIPECMSKNSRCICSSCKARRKAVEKGDAIIENLFGHYTGLKAYLAERLEFMNKYRISYSEFGRIRLLPDIRSEDYKKRNHAIKAGFNLPIQSYGASICKRAMITLAERGFITVNQIHDAIIIESADVTRDLPIMKQIMENVVSLSVPLVVEPKILNSFDEKDVYVKQ